MDKDIRTVLHQVLQQYELDGSIVAAEACTNGHINDTYNVTVEDKVGVKVRLVVQRINGHVFLEPAKVMHNIQQVTDHMTTKEAEEDCSIISFLNTRSGNNYTIIDGDYWRVCYFVPESITYDFVEDSSMLYNAGFAFGRFQNLLSDLPMDSLYETIPDFHNTRQRLDTFFDMVVKDPLGRATDVQADIAFFERNRDLACRLTDLQQQGALPLRVTHNDTKYNNILMHEVTREPLCVIDLDTVMPGLTAHDFGDAIRFAANTAVEDEPDTSKVALNMANYREFTRGFLEACGSSLTRTEIETMALGAVAITIELASRFLADHIDGDKYFRIHRPNHNLERARCQIALANDMLRHFDEMQELVVVSAKAAV